MDINNLTVEERLEVLFNFWGVNEKDIPGLIRSVLKIIKEGS